MTVGEWILRGGLALFSMPVLFPHLENSCPCPKWVSEQQGIVLLALLTAAMTVLGVSAIVPGRSALPTIPICGSDLGSSGATLTVTDSRSDHGSVSQHKPIQEPLDRFSSLLAGDAVTYAWENDEFHGAAGFADSGC